MYDVKCEDLARDFLDDALMDMDAHQFAEKAVIVDRTVPQLAQRIQDCIEDFLAEFEAHRREVEAPSKV